MATHTSSVLVFSSAINGRQAEIKVGIEQYKEDRPVPDNTLE